MEKLECYDRRNGQKLEVVQITWEDYSEPYLNKGIIAKDEEGNFYELDFEDVEILGDLEEDIEIPF